MPSSTSLRRRDRTYGRKARVQGVTGDQTVKSGHGILGRLIIRNTGAAATVTIKDGGTTLLVVDAPVTTSVGAVVVPLDIPMATSIIVSPSAATVDCLVAHD